MLLSEHAGTHLDAPYHFDEAGLAVEQLPLSRLFARARVLDLTAKQPLEGIGPRDLEEAARRGGIEIAAGDAAVVWTEHSRNYERPDYTWHRPFITAAGADWLAERRPALVVTDLVGLDEPVDHVTPVHNRLLTGRHLPAPGADQRRPAGGGRELGGRLPAQARPRDRLAGARVGRAGLTRSG